MTATLYNQIAPTKESGRWLDVFIWLYIAVLIFFSVFYAQERIIAYDTALYLSNVLTKGTFHVETNRFVSALPQILPLLGYKLGLSLTSIILLYSLNFTVIPVACCLCSLYLLKNKGIALAILLFYTIMNARIFYYPVSELQSGLVFLLLYDALLCYFISRKTHWITGTALSIPIISIIVFSHPLSIAALGAWVVWFISFKENRSKLLVIPILTAAIAFWVKQKFFRAISGGFDYEQDKQDNLENFLNPISTYFNSSLAKASWKEYTNHYFVIFLLILFAVTILIYRRRLLAAAILPCIIFSFWLLVTVSFPNSSYTFYQEHLYQPMSFFVALGFSYVISLANISPAIKIGLLSVTAVVSFGKIAAGHLHNCSKINFYKPYIDYMLARHIRKAALPRHFLPGNFDSYWAGEWESKLVSGQAGPDSAILLYLHYSPESMLDVGNKRGYNNAHYFRILEEIPPISFDSIATPKQIDSLNQISKHNPDH